VPGRKTSLIVKRQTGDASKPVLLSISTKERFGGTSNSSSITNSSPFSSAILCFSLITLSKKPLHTGRAHFSYLSLSFSGPGNI